MTDVGYGYDVEEHVTDVEQTHQPVVAPNEDGTYTCPECQGIFDTPQGMGSHRWSKHKVSSAIPRNQNRPRKTPVTRPRLPCSVCGKEIRQDNLPRHIKTKHPDTIVSTNGTDYQVDDIFGSVAKVLFPSGSVPVSALPALIEWRAATEKLLDSLPRS